MRDYTNPSAAFEQALTDRDAFEESQKATDLSNVTEIYHGFVVLAIYGEAYTFSTEPDRRFPCTPWQSMPGSSTRSSILEWSHPEAYYETRNRYRNHVCPNCNRILSGVYVG